MNFRPSMFTLALSTAPSRHAPHASPGAGRSRLSRLFRRHAADVADGTTVRAWRPLRAFAYFALTAVVAANAVVALPTVGPLISTSSVVATAAALLPVMWNPDRGHAVSLAAVTAAVVSLTVTCLYSGPASNTVANWWVLETAVLLLLLVSAVRRPRAPAAVALAVILTAAVVASPLRVGFSVTPPTSPREALQLCLIWLVLAVAAVGVGCYLRFLDARYRATAAAERQAQRLALAHDLHDFAAHDVTSVVVLAQAAQVLAETETERALELLPQIESAGKHALAAMDRTVKIFAAADADEEDTAAGQAGEDTGNEHRLPQHDMSELPALTARFTRTGSVRTRLDVAEDVLPRLTPELSAVGYRIVVEALTNVRRHAVAATLVEINALIVGHGDSDHVHLTVVNDAAGRAEPSALSDPHRQGGIGLTGLAERVTALGGTLHAGSYQSAGWRVRVCLPLTLPCTAAPPLPKGADPQGSGPRQRGFRPV
ncbi:sensor histidine kinase [Streptomyces celluloflavus]|uniref:histidine kinase n=2 Tax=Streptomyces celluloflavus TaxID=58344 RepID=A0ABW7RIS8_9ACTN|nr:histidine kinase [Streptomyces celluloflavus]